MKRLLQNRTVKFKIMVYNICIICVIGIIFSVTSYVTANKKAVQLAQNSVEYHGRASPAIIRRSTSRW